MTSAVGWSQLATSGRHRCQEENRESLSVCWPASAGGADGSGQSYTATNRDNIFVGTQTKLTLCHFTVSQCSTLKHMYTVQLHTNFSQKCGRHSSYSASRATHHKCLLFILLCCRWWLCLLPPPTVPLLPRQSQTLHQVCHRVDKSRGHCQRIQETSILHPSQRDSRGYKLMSVRLWARPCRLGLV